MRCTPAVCHCFTGPSMLITLRSVLTSQGRACPNASQVNGTVLTRAREDKEAKYHELLSSERCCLVVVALETGGRLSGEAIEFVTSLVGSPARDAPPPLCGSAFHFGRRRWIRMLSMSCVRTVRPRWSLPGQRLLTGRTGLRPIWSSCFQLDWSECRFPSPVSCVSSVVFLQMIVFSVVHVASFPKVLGMPMSTDKWASLNILDNQTKSRLKKLACGMNSDELRNLEPDTVFQLDEDKFAGNVSAEAAPGPSGMTADHLRPLLKSHQDTQLMCKMAGRFTQGQVPDNIVDAVRLGRMTAHVKPAGRVRGIVVGDIFSMHCHF